MYRGQAKLIMAKVGLKLVLSSWSLSQPLGNAAGHFTNQIYPWRRDFQGRCGKKCGFEFKELDESVEIGSERLSARLHKAGSWFRNN